MKVICQCCGATVTVRGLGRKKLAIPFKNICDRIRAYKNVLQAAEDLGCSKSYIFQELKDHNVKLAELMK